MSINIYCPKSRNTFRFGANQFRFVTKFFWNGHKTGQNTPFVKIFIEIHAHSNIQSEQSFIQRLIKCVNICSLWMVGLKRIVCALNHCENTWNYNNWSSCNGMCNRVHSIELNLRSTNKSSAINSRRLKLLWQCKVSKMPKKCLYKFELMMTKWNNIVEMFMYLFAFQFHGAVSELIHRSLFCCVCRFKNGILTRQHWRNRQENVPFQWECYNINAAKVNIIWDAITSQRNWVQAAFWTRLWRILNVMKDWNGVSYRAFMTTKKPFYEKIVCYFS